MYKGELTAMTDVYILPDRSMITGEGLEYRHPTK